jgi:hypothetical protein
VALLDIRTNPTTRVLRWFGVLLLVVGWIGWVLSYVVLAAIFYVVFTAVGTLMRVVGYDPLARGIDRRASSYWVAREPVDDVQRYFRQY